MSATHLSIGRAVAGPVRLRWAFAFTATTALALAITLAVRNSGLLPGERTLTRWSSELDVAGIGTIVDVLDFVSDDSVAPWVFAAIFPVVWLAWGRYPALAYFATGALSGLTRVTDLASRPRPTDDLAWSEVVSGAGGYPSGHVVYAVLVFGMLAYLAGRHMKRGRGRAALVTLLVLAVVTMGPARVINLDHWAMDVVGSYLLALPFLIAAAWLYPRLPVWLDAAPRLRSLIGADRVLPEGRPA